ncbi:DUF1648 domain-containing protein [Citricoccus sp.]|uniref:DUF1648 domain-containing protein n=1 Tax=Citricoccus sp. TaxID=1978372 RepID=UPI0028BE4AF7|nr:DUF1648 domain-containing protein [Citricoccus sp.]
MSDDTSPDLPGLRQGRSAAWLPFLLSLIALAVIVVWGLRLYPGLPETIPTHWGPGGAPDAWEEKSFGSVFMPQMIAAGTTALMAVLALVIPALMNPPKDPSAWKRYRLEGAERATISVLGWISLLTVLLVGYLGVQGWTGPHEVSFAWPMALYVLLVFLMIVLPYRRWSRWADAQSSEHGFTPTIEEEAEEKLWLPGGIHNNPDEPRIMVLKREGYGTGTTINVGNRAGRITVIVFLVVFVGGPLSLVFAVG